MLQPQIASVVIVRSPKGNLPRRQTAARLLLLLGVCSIVLCTRAALPFFQETTLDAQKLNEIPAALQKFVDDKVVAGAVTLVMKKGEPARVDAVGMSDIANQRAMKPDDVFWIASMTKPVTAAAVMMLQDEGKLSIEDPVEKHLPEFTNMWMVVEKTKDRINTVPAPRPITIKDLLTHTSGLPDVSRPRVDTTLAELVMAYSQKPLNFPPGSKWEYSNSGINTLGRIVEAVSKQRFEAFLEKRILHPLGMLDTTFWLTPAQHKRLARSYKPVANIHGLEEVDIPFVSPLMDRRRAPMPAGGLFSTARDMATFYELMLNKGMYKGKKLLSEEAVTAMTQTQTGSIKTGFVNGMSWGLGFQVVKEPQGVTAMLTAGTFGHGGAHATQSWADPAKDLIMILMIQRAGFPNGDDSPVRKVFQELAAASVKK